MISPACLMYELWCHLEQPQMRNNSTGSLVGITDTMYRISSRQSLRPLRMRVCLFLVHSHVVQEGPKATRFLACPPLWLQCNNMQHKPVFEPYWAAWVCLGRKGYPKRRCWRTRRLSPILAESHADLNPAAISVQRTGDRGR